MNKMRKWMTMAMAGTLAVTSLGTSMVFAEDGSDKIDMTMMVWGNVDDYIPSNEVLMEKFPELAEKINLNVELGGSGDSDVAEKLRLMLASGEELPDLVRLNYTQFPEFAEAGVLYDLSDAIAPYEDDIIDAAKTLMTYDGSYYAVPQEVKPKVWLYRKDIFDDCGVNPDEIKTVMISWKQQQPSMRNIRTATLRTMELR